MKFNIIAIFAIVALLFMYKQSEGFAPGSEVAPDAKYRAEVAYGTVLQDPFIRSDPGGIPLVYYDRHLTEQMIQREKYVPNRIRPPNGPIFWQDNSDSELKRIFDFHKVPLSERYNIVQALGMPNVTS